MCGGEWTAVDSSPASVSADVLQGVLRVLEENVGASILTSLSQLALVFTEALMFIAWETVVRDRSASASVTLASTATRFSLAPRVKASGGRSSWVPRFPSVTKIKQKREALLDIEAAERLQMQHVSVLAKDVALDDEPMQRLVRKVCCACEHALHCTTACSPSAKGCERY